jgi:hypothetical protein
MPDGLEDGKNPLIMLTSMPFQLFQLPIEFFVHGNGSGSVKAQKPHIPIGKMGPVFR